MSKGSKSITESADHAKMLMLALSLASTGKPVDDDDDLILWLLKCVGSEFDPIVVAVNT